MSTSDQPGTPEAVDAARRATMLEYDTLRQKLHALWSAPERDMVAIDQVLRRLDETHAEFKALHGRDQQRY